MLSLCYKTKTQPRNFLMDKSTINNSINQIQGTLFALSSLQSKKVEASFTFPDLMLPFKIDLIMDSRLTLNGSYDKIKSKH